MLVDQASVDPLRLKNAVLGVPGVVDVGNIRSRSYGHRAAVDLVVIVAPDLSTVSSHDIASRVEQVIRSQMPIEMVTVHIEPAEAK